MAKSKKVTIKVTYDMYLFLNRNFREVKDKMKFENKSDYFNYIVDVYTQKLTRAKLKTYDEFDNVQVAKKLLNIKEIEGKKCKVISFTLKEENCWYIQYYLSKFNKENINKNVYYLLALHYLKNTSQR